MCPIWMLASPVVIQRRSDLLSKSPSSSRPGSRWLPLQSDYSCQLALTRDLRGLQGVLLLGLSASSTLTPNDRRAYQERRRRCAWRGCGVPTMRAVLVVWAPCLIQLRPFMQAAVCLCFSRSVLQLQFGFAGVGSVGKVPVGEEGSHADAPLTVRPYYLLVWSFVILQIR